MQNHQSKQSAETMEAWRQVIARNNNLACVVTKRGLRLMGDLLEVTSLGVTLDAIDAFTPSDETHSLLGETAPPLGWAFIPWHNIALITDGNDIEVPEWDDSETAQ